MAVSRRPTDPVPVPEHDPAARPGRPGRPVRGTERPVRPGGSLPGTPQGTGAGKGAITNRPRYTGGR